MTAFETIIICIDRDNDIGEKTENKGPIIGEEECKKAGKDLLLADPEDTDANSIFGALKLKKEISNSEIVILTGDKDVGLKSDQELVKQLEYVIDKIKPKNAIVVTDGAEDEYIIPIIQSRIPIISVKRIVVKQSERLETGYYMLKDFIKYISTNPRLARVLIGLPAIAIILIAIFGATAWRFILGTVGIYLFIKGFQLEDLTGRIIGYVVKSFTTNRLSSFILLVSGIFFVSGIIFGYNKVHSIQTDLLNKIIFFVKESLLFFSASAFFLWFEKFITAKKDLYKYLTFLAFIFATTIVSYSSIEFILNPEKLNELLFSIILGFLAIIIFLMVEKIQKSNIKEKISKKISFKIPKKKKSRQ